MHPLANSHCKCRTDFYSVCLTSLCQNGRCVVNFDFILVPEIALTVNNTKKSLYFEQQGELHESLSIILKH